MNKQRLFEVANAIENHTVQGLMFDMNHYAIEHTCGAVGCIAGWLVALKTNSAPRELAQFHGNRILEEASEYAGLTKTEAYPLFHCMNVDDEEGVFGYHLNDHMEKIEEATAVAVIREYANTGVLDWEENVLQLQPELHNRVVEEMEDV